MGGKGVELHSLSLVASRATEISIETRRTSVALSHRRCSRMDQISLDRPFASIRHEKSQLFSSCLFFFLSRISHQQPL